jgi:RHS repeat-associated protein
MVEWRGPDGAAALIERPSEGRPTALPRLGAVLHADGAGFRFERGPGETWWYDEAGRPVRVRVGQSEIVLEWSGARLSRIDHPRSGRWVLLEWNEPGTLITAVRASDGRVISFSYDVGGQLLAVDGGPQGARRYRCLGGLVLEVVDADGVTLVRNTFDEAGRVLSQLTPEGRLVRFGYSEGYRTLVTDASGGAINEYRHDAAGRLIRVVDDADRVFHRVFDDAGHLRGIQERSGARWAMDYDDAGNLVHRAGPCGITEQWTWDERGRLTTHTDPRGSVTRWVYAGSARTPVEIVDAAGAVIRITVSDDDLPTCVVDPDGVTTRFVWDVDGQLVERAVAGGGRTRLRYDAAGRLVEIIGPDGHPRQWETDDAGRVVLEQAPGGARSRFHYTAAGRPDGYVDPAGGRWASAYGAHGRVEQVTDPLGSTVGFEYDPFGNTRLVVAPDGQKFHFDHDGLNRLVAVSDPTGATFRRGYDPDGRPTVESDGDGHEWQVRYDDAGRPVERTAPDGRTWRREYDPAGSVVAATDPAGATTRYEYDPCGRVVAVIDAAGGRRTVTWTAGGRLASVISPLGHTLSYGYDKAGWLAQTLSPSGRRTLCRRDPAGRLTALVTPAGKETRWEYDAQGAVSAVIRPGGRRLTIERNPLGLLTAVTDGDGAVRRYTYDARGALTSVIDPLGAVTRYEYDARGQVSAWTDPLGGRHLLRYDEVGRQTAVTDPLGRTTAVTRDRNGAVETVRYSDGSGLRWWRDPAGRLVGRGVSGGDQPRLRYGYDPAGRLVTAEPASPASPADAAGPAAPDTTVRLDYDVVGQLVARTTAAGRLEFGYDADGRRVSAGRAGAVPLAYDYDEDGYLRAVDHPALGPRRLARDADGRPDVRGRTVERDAAGRIVRIDQHGTELRFGYDAAGQLVTAEGPWGRQTLTWDLGGRLIAEDHGDSASTVRSTYDDAGQLVTRQVGDAAATTFRYDAAGRRVSADGPAGTVEYAWDALGHLTAVRRSSESGAGPEGRATRLVVDALGDPLQINGVGVLWDPVDWPGQVHSLGATTYARAGSALGIVEGGAGGQGEGRWVETDWQGSTGSYDPWGLPIPGGPAGEPGGTAGTAGPGYRGELAVDGLVWQRERVLDPGTRSFLSPDPLDHVPGMPGAANPYHYTWNDPVGMLDPTGLRPLSDADYKYSQSGMFGQAWDNIRQDPWGDLAAAGVIAAGVGLMFVPGGQVIGAGILIGAGASAGLGLVTGNFNPRAIAISGAVGAIGGGVGAALAKAGASALTSNAVSSWAQDLVTQELAHPGHLNVGELAFAVGTGGLAGRLGAKTPLRDGDVLAVDGHSTDPEIYYRSMSNDDYSTLTSTRRLPASFTGETMISPTREFSEAYDGRLVRFTLRPGTTQSLAAIGERDTSKRAIAAYPDMPVVSPGWMSRAAFFKGEGKQINIGLGRGPALDVFNQSILRFKEIAR